MLLTRFAPTPSGFLHLGNAFNFYVIQQWAKKSKAKTRLRIDDLDRERVRHEYLDDIFRLLKFLKLEPDFGPKNRNDFLNNFSQKHRLDLYMHGIKLAEKHPLFYRCECSRKQLLALKPLQICECPRKKLAKGALRVNTLEISQKDSFENIDIHKEMPFFSIQKSNGDPSYQLASVVDDAHYGVNALIRGDDLRASTAAQIFLSKELSVANFHPKVVLHHPLLLNDNFEKLSKSAGRLSKSLWISPEKKLEDFVGFFDAKISEMEIF